MIRNANFKVLMVSIVLALLFVAVGANVFIVSVLGQHLNSGTNITYQVEGIHEVKNVLHAKRGQILDRNGVVLAQDTTAYTLYASIDATRIDSQGNPQYVHDKETAAQQLAPILGLSYEGVLGYLNQDVKQVEFGVSGKYLTLSQKEQIEALGIPGLGFTEILSRYYPLESMAANLIGFARYDETVSSLSGQIGIEAYYNKYLQGQNGYEEYRQDREGYALRQEEGIYTAAQNGNNIVLTLDTAIQETLEDALLGFSTDSQVQAGESWGAVMEIDTGRIVGWAEYPSYNLNLANIENYNNKGSQYAYEPGSTMKTFTVAAAIDQGVYPGQTLFDSGSFYVTYENGKAVRSSTPTSTLISNHNNLDYGMITYDRGYEVSSNVMISELLTKYLDPEIFHDYLYKLGFFKAVDTDAIPEVEGYDLWEWPLEKVTNGFGQGSTVTMLQMLQAYSSVLSDGTMVKPYFIDQIIDPNTQEVVYEGQTTVTGKPFKDTTAKEVQRLMRGVVTSGSARRFNISEIEVLGKTGTAQMVVDGSYSSTQYLFSSVLGFPADDPKYVIYTAYRANIGHSVDASAKYVNEIVKKVVSTYGLSSENGSTVIQPSIVNQLSNYRNLSLEYSQSQLTSLGYTPIIIGGGKTVIDQYPQANTRLLSNERIFLYTGNTAIEMPDMTGWSMKEVNAFAALTSIPITTHGNGYVTSQSLGEGTSINNETVIEVSLE